MTPSISFRYLDEPAMIQAGVTDMARCIDVMEEALVLLNRGDYRMAGEGGNSHGAMLTFPKNPQFETMPADGPDRRFMAMPAYLGGNFRATGVKWYGSNVENRALGLPRSILLFVLNDTDTGAPRAVMSANLLSAYRTGAVPGVAVRHLARQDARIFGLIGPGVIGRAVTEAALCARPSIDTIVVKGIDAADTQRYADYVAQRFPRISKVVAVADNREVVAIADIVSVTATTDASGSRGFPYIDHTWIKPGALLLHPAAVRYDDSLYEQENTRFVVDYLGLYEAWRCEMGKAAYEGTGILGNRWYDLASQSKSSQSKFSMSRIENIGDVIEGARPGRTSGQEVTIFSAGGMPVEDVAWAHSVFTRAEAEDLGVKLPLWETPALA